MGAPTQMFGGVGNDGFGRAVLGRLTADGVGVAGVSILDTHSTGVAFSQLLSGRSAGLHLSSGRTTAADSFGFDAGHLPAGPIVLHVSAASLGSAPLRDRILAAVPRVLADGGRISCDPNARPQLFRGTMQPAMPCGRSWSRATS